MTQGKELVLLTAPINYFDHPHLQLEWTYNCQPLLKMFTLYTWVFSRSSNFSEYQVWTCMQTGVMLWGWNIWHFLPNTRYPKAASETSQQYIPGKQLLQSCYASKSRQYAGLKDYKTGNRGRKHLCGQVEYCSGYLIQVIIPPLSKTRKMGSDSLQTLRSGENHRQEVTGSRQYKAVLQGKNVTQFRLSFAYHTRLVLQFFYAPQDHAGFGDTA